MFEVMGCRALWRASICLLIGALLLSTLQASFSGISYYAPPLRGAQTQPPDPWPTFHHDLGRSGFTSGGAPLNPRFLWNFTTGDSIESSPIIANGTVYFGSEDGYLYALNQSTGVLLWRSAVGAVAFSSPTLYGNSIYVASNLLSRVNASNGQKIWSVYVGSVVHNSLLAVGEKVYVSADYSDKVSAINANNGSTVWTLNVSKPQQLAYDRGVVFVGSAFPGDHRIFAVNATTGAVIWSFQTDTEVVGGLTVSNGILYGGGSVSSFGNLTAFNSTTGQVLWKHSQVIVGPPAIGYGRLFLEGGSALVVLNVTDGSFLWGFRFDVINAVSFSMPALAGGLVFVGGGADGDFPDPTLYCLNATTGKLVWALFLGSRFWPYGDVNSSPAISNGTVYVGSGRGTLYAITSRTVMPNSTPPWSSYAIAIGFGGSALALLGSLVFVYGRRRYRRGKIGHRLNALLPSQLS